MGYIYKIFTIFAIVTSLLPANEKTDNQLQKIDYDRIIEDYLNQKFIEPTIVFNNDEGYKEIDLLHHKISWKELKEGIEITIDGNTIRTDDKVTLNVIWNSGVDNVKFANFVQQIKIYEYKSLIGFVLTNVPCTGLGCGVNYQLVYDLKSKKESYFGRFRTGFEFELYDFNSDNKPDYLSKTFYGRNTQGIDMTEFVMYSQTENGTFQEFKTDKQGRFWFKHTYTEFHTDLKHEKFEEKWIENIYQNKK